MAAYMSVPVHTILVLDVDGTLRGPGEFIGDGVPEFLRECAAQDVGIVPCSGKSATFLDDLFRVLGVPILAIGAENGGHIVYDPRGSAYDEVCSVDEHALHQAELHLRECCECNSWIMVEPKRSIITRRFGSHACALEKASVWQHHVSRLIGRRQVQVFTYPADNAVDLVVNPQNVRKSLVIRFLRARHPEARFIVAGDGLNDLSMMDMRGIVLVPVCPANAVPEIKDAVWRMGGVVAQAPYGAGTVEAIRMVLSWDRLVEDSESAGAPA